jgi:cobalt-zinc-cadmium efflux system outer membrane protein
MVLLVAFLLPVPVLAQTQVKVPLRLTLQDAQRLLANHNPQLQAAKLSVDVEQGDVIDVAKYPNPTASLDFNGVVLDSERGRLLDRLQPSVLFRQEILTSGRREKRIRVQQAETEIASIQVNDIHRSLRFELQTAYFQVVLAQRDLEVTRSILAQFKEIVGLNQARYDAGEASGAELRRTQAAEYSFFSAVVDAEVRLEGARSNLLALVGATDLAQPFEAVEDFNPAFTVPPEAELREIALRQRPDLAAERARVQRAALSIELEEARSKPNLSAVAGYQRELDSSGPVAGIELPLFLFNRNEGPVHRAKAEKRRRENRTLFKQITVLKQVRLALQRLEGVGRRIQALEGGYLARARESRDITDASYRLGEASLIEFLDAERTYSETRLLYNQALFESAIGRARLELAIGEDLAP